MFDQELLEGFVASLFQPTCFDLNFPLCRCVHMFRPGIAPSVPLASKQDGVVVLRQSETKNMRSTLLRNPMGALMYPDA